MTTIDFSNVIKIKNAVNEKFGEYVHFHDACGGQYFSLETDSDDIRDFIKDFMLKIDYKVIFDKSGLSFTLEDNK